MTLNSVGLLFVIRNSVCGGNPMANVLGGTLPSSIALYYYSGVLLLIQTLCSCMHCSITSRPISHCQYLFLHSTIHSIISLLHCSVPLLYSVTLCYICISPLGPMDYSVALLYCSKPLHHYSCSQAVIFFCSADFGTENVGS